MPEIIRNALRRKLRTTLTVLGITIGIFALAVLGAMAEKINRLSQGANRYLGHRVQVAEAGRGLFTAGLAPLTIVQQVEAIEGVACVETNVETLAEEEFSFTFGAPRLLEGVDVGRIRRCQAANPYLPTLSFVQGDWWREGERGKVVLGVDLAQHLKAKKIGDTVTIRGREFQVAGLLERTLTGPDSFAFVPIDDARLILAEAFPVLKEVDLTKYASEIYALPLPGQDPDDLARAIQAALPDVKVFPPSEVVGRITGFTRVFNLIILGVAMIGLIVGGLSVINTMVMSIAERTREIGLKKAVGASDGDILREYLLEAAFIGLLGGLLGLAAGAGLVTLINRLTAPTGTIIFLLTWRLALGTVAFATVLGVLAGLMPSLRASRLKPVEALKAE